MSRTDIIITLLIGMLLAGVQMMGGQLTGLVMVGVALWGLWWFFAPTVAEKYDAARSRPLMLVWGGRIVILLLCLLLGWKISHNAQKQPYTIRGEDEVEFVKMLHDLGGKNVEIAYATKDKKALALKTQLFSLFEQCGWDPKEVDANTMGEDLLPGVTIWAGQQNEGLPTEAGILKTLLKKQHIETRTKFLAPAPAPNQRRHHFLKVYVGPDPEDRPKR